MEQKQNNKLCRKCLLEDFAPEEYLQSMRVYIKGLDEESKADDHTYHKRLALCKDCENLYEGMCRICGCFVEYRAALKIKTCPGVTPRW